MGHYLVQVGQLHVVAVHTCQISITVVGNGQLVPLEPGRRQREDIGQTARRIRHVDGESVWVRPLADGGKAVALVNRSPIAREIRVSFVELGFGTGQHWVKDLWRCEGKHSGFYVAQVPPHATKLIYTKPDSCPKCD